MAQSHVSIRQARRGDDLTIAEFNVSMAWETEATRLDLDVVRRGVRRLLERPADGFYLVAEIGDQVAGVLMVTTEWSDWHNGVYWWIQSVYVQPVHRRAGVFRQLYAAVKQQAASDNEVRAFRLYVERNNHRAQQTYQTLGMTQTHYRIYEEIATRPVSDR